MTIASTLTLRFRGLLGTHNDVDAAGDDFDVKDALEAMFEKSMQFDLAPGIANANTTLTHIFRAKRAIKILAAYYVPDGTLTGHNVNYAKIDLLSGNGAAAAATVVGTRNTDTATTDDMAAGTPWALTLTAANVNLAAGETLAARILKYGAAGVAVPAGHLHIDYREQ